MIPDSILNGFTPLTGRAWLRNYFIELLYDLGESGFGLAIERQAGFWHGSMPEYRRVFRRINGRTIAVEAILY